MAVDEIKLAQELIRFHSLTPPQKSYPALEKSGLTLEQAVAFALKQNEQAQDLIASELKKLNFYTQPQKYGDTSALYARYGAQGPHICFNTHTDVVIADEPTQWKYKPFRGEIADGKLWGRGAVDNKGSTACAVAACAQLLEQYDVAGSISFMISGDEEDTRVRCSKQMIEWMADKKLLPDFIIGTEPTNPTELGQEIKNGRRGSFYGDVTIKGVSGHAAYPEKANNPVPKLAELFSMLAALKIDDGMDTFQPSNLQLLTMDVANPSNNVTASLATGRFSVRFNPLWDAAKLEAFLREKMDETGIKYEMTTKSPSKPFHTPLSPHTDALFKSVQEVTGRTPKFTTNGGTSDLRFTAPYCLGAEFGLVNETIHKANEHVSLKDMRDLTEIYRRTLEKFFAGHLTPKTSAPAPV